MDLILTYALCTALQLEDACANCFGGVPTGVRISLSDPSFVPTSEPKTQEDARSVYIRLS